MDAPAAAVGDAADLLHIDVDHAPGPPGLDGAGPAQRFAVDVEVIQAREAETCRSHRVTVATEMGMSWAARFAHDPAR